MGLGDTGFEVSITRLDDRVVVAVSGEVDISVADRLWATVEAGLADTVTLAIDLRDTRFLDSSGIMVLVRACHRVEAAGGSLTVYTSPGVVRRVLAASGLIERLNVDPLEQEQSA